MVETFPRGPEIDDLLFEFAGSAEIVDADYIRTAMRRVGIDETRLGEIVELLTEPTFLGQEISPGRFDFINDEAVQIKTKVMARNLSEGAGRPIS